MLGFSEFTILNEGNTSAQTVQKIKANLKNSGQILVKHKDGGEHGEHVIFHATSSGDRYKTVVKGDTTISRPARSNEATHFAKMPEEAPKPSSEASKKIPSKK